MIKKILFIHHSTGGNLIKEGNLQEEIKLLDSNIQFWDHNYNLYKTFPSLLALFTHHKGLTDNKGVITGKDFNIVLSNNSPKEYSKIFSRNTNDATLKAILNFDLIAFKNCYPTTRIASNQQLEEDIHYYEQIRDSLKKYSKKQFVLLTPPPARENTTNRENAHRARNLIDWLNSKEFLHGATNLHVFDFFGSLADKDGYLRKEYERFLSWDSHPNTKANKIISPIFAEYLTKIVLSS